jgi:hypothetical protein
MERGSKISISCLVEYKAKEKKKRERERVKREEVLAKTTETPARQVKPVR